MKEHPSIFASTVFEEGRRYIKRALDDEEICAPTVGYNDYIKNRVSEGVCFGASLFWATQSLKRVRTHNLPFGVKTKTPTEATPTKFKLKFYEYSNNLQYSFEHLFLEKQGEEELVSLLNQQEARIEDYLNRGFKAPVSRLHYHRISAMRAADIAKGMLNDEPAYKSSALILSTALNLSATSGTLEHASVLLHFNKRLFFFDVNRGVYYIAHPGKLHWSSLLLTIAENFDLDERYQENYRIAPRYNILINVL